MRTVVGGSLDRLNIRNIQEAYGLLPRYERLRNRGMLTISEVAEKLGITYATAKTWNQAELLKSHPYNDKHE
jgi:hypothetical protein